MDAYKEITNAIDELATSKINGKTFQEWMKVFHDVEPVVRCKDCTFLMPSEIGMDSPIYGCSVVWSCSKHKRTVSMNYFCADGKNSKKD